MVSVVKPVNATIDQNNDNNTTCYLGSEMLHVVFLAFLCFFSIFFFSIITEDCVAVSNHLRLCLDAWIKEYHNEKTEI